VPEVRPTAAERTLYEASANEAIVSGAGS